MDEDPTLLAQNLEHQKHLRYRKSRRKSAKNDHPRILCHPLKDCVVRCRAQRDKERKTEEHCISCKSPQSDWGRRYGAETATWGRLAKPQSPSNSRSKQREQCHSDDRSKPSRGSRQQCYCNREFRCRQCSSQRWGEPRRQAKVNKHIVRSLGISKLCYCSNKEEASESKPRH